MHKAAGNLHHASCLHCLSWASCWCSLGGIASSQPGVNCCECDPLIPAAPPPTLPSASLQNPVPADQLTAERLGCGNPGGAPGSITAPEDAPEHVAPADHAQGPAEGARPTQPLSTGPWGALMAKTMGEAEQQGSGSQEGGA